MSIAGLIGPCVPCMRGHHHVPLWISLPLVGLTALVFIYALWVMFGSRP